MPSARTRSRFRLKIKDRYTNKPKKKRKDELFNFQLDTGFLHTTLCFVVRVSIFFFFLVQLSTTAFNGSAWLLFKAHLKPRYRTRRSLKSVKSVSDETSDVVIDASASSSKRLGD